MTAGEVITRGQKIIFNYFNSLKFRNSRKWPYSKMGNGLRIRFFPLPKTLDNLELKEFKVFDKILTTKEAG